MKLLQALATPSRHIRARSPFWLEMDTLRHLTRAAVWESTSPVPLFGFATFSLFAVSLTGLAALLNNDAPHGPHLTTPHLFALAAVCLLLAGGIAWLMFSKLVLPLDAKGYKQVDALTRPEWVDTIAQWAAVSKGRLDTRHLRNLENADRWRCRLKFMEINRPSRAASDGLASLRGGEVLARMEQMHLSETVNETANDLSTPAMRVSRL